MNPVCQTGQCPRCKHVAPLMMMEVLDGEPT